MGKSLAAGTDLIGGGCYLLCADCDLNQTLIQILDGGVEGVFYFGKVALVFSGHTGSQIANCNTFQSRRGLIDRRYYCIQGGINTVDKLPISALEFCGIAPFS